MNVAGLDVPAPSSVWYGCMITAPRSPQYAFSVPIMSWKFTRRRLRNKLDDYPLGSDDEGSAERDLAGAWHRSCPARTCQSGESRCNRVRSPAARGPVRRLTPNCLVPPRLAQRGFGGGSRRGTRTTT